MKTREKEVRREEKVSRLREAFEVVRTRWSERARREFFEVRSCRAFGRRTVLTLRTTALAANSSRVSRSPIPARQPLSQESSRLARSAIAAGESRSPG